MTSISAEDRQRAIRRIQKCLALAKSPEPYEAAAAIRQAQKLMSSLGLTEDEVAGLEATSEVVITKEAFGGCRYLAKLVNIIQVAFGVAGVWEPGRGISRVRANIRYIGPKGRVQLAVYTHRVVNNAVNAAWREHLETAPGPSKKQKPGARMSFRIAFLTAIEEKIMKLSPTESEALAIQRYQAAMYGTGLHERSGPKWAQIDFDAYLAGAERGAEFDLMRPLTEDQALLIEDGRSVRP